MRRISEERAIWLGRHILPHEPALRNWLGRWRLDDLEIDDIVQEAYARLAARETVEDINAPRSYLFQTARSIILSHLRHARVVSIRAVEDLEKLSVPSDAPGQDVQISDREQLHILAEAISALPEPGRRAFLMRVVDGLSHREIASRLGLSENAAQKSVAKSLQKLMKLMGRGGFDAPEASNRDEGKEFGGSHVQARDERRD